MEDLENKLWKPRELLLDPFSDTFATAKMRLELPRHRHLLSCKVDSDCVTASTETLVETIAEQFFREKWDTSGSDEGIRGRKIVAQSLDGWLIWKEMSS